MACVTPPLLPHHHPLLHLHKLLETRLGVLGLLTGVSLLSVKTKPVSNAS